MPNRLIKESICTSEEIDELSWFEEVLFYRLITKCDDYGRYDGRAKIIKGTAFPLKNVTASDIDKALKKLSAVGLVNLYEYDGKPYLQLTTWSNHQQIRAKKSKYPPFDVENVDEYICNQLISDDSKCPRNPIQSNPTRESNPNPNHTRESESKSESKRFIKPSLEEVTTYISENMFCVDPDVFYDYYEANGWTISGKAHMKDWKATIRNWDRREQNNKRPTHKELAF